MFRLSNKKRLLRSSVVGAAVVATIGFVGNLIATQSNQETNAAGSTVTLQYTPGEENQIRYSGSFTYPFEVQDGATSMKAYCLQPHLTPSDPGSTLEVVSGIEVSGDTVYPLSTEYVDLIKMMIYIYQFDNNATNELRNTIFNRFGATTDSAQYAWTHAIVSAMVPDF